MPSLADDPTSNSGIRRRARLEKGMSAFILDEDDTGDAGRAATAGATATDGYDSTRPTGM
ncbi:MAG: hypothetical protein AAF587_44950 [Bacteroidota bacterium]